MSWFWVFPSLLCLVIYSAAWGTWAVRSSRGEVADIAWGPGIALLCWSVLLQLPSLPGLGLCLMVTLWGGRLAWHLWPRQHAHQPDFRYRSLLGAEVASPRPAALLSKVVVPQSAMALLTAGPTLWAIAHLPQLRAGYLFGAACGIWALGFVYEVVADWQLGRFQRLKEVERPPLLVTGLWRFSRHPNLFGELVMWWALFAICAQTEQGAWWVLSPTLLSLCLYYLSGVRPLDRRLQGRRGWEHYAAATPALIPLPLLASGLYAGGWMLIAAMASEQRMGAALLLWCMTLGGESLLIWWYWRRALLLAPILMVAALLCGLVNEPVLLYSGGLEYPNRGLPAIWLLSIYPLFGITMLSSSALFRSPLSWMFLSGGTGAVISYHIAQWVGALQVQFWAIPLLFILWGGTVTLMIHLQRTLSTLLAHLTDPVWLAQPYTVFFDGRCSLCLAEKNRLAARTQRGTLHYVVLEGPADLDPWSDRLDYDTAMRSLHLLPDEGPALQGVDALVVMYARTNLLWLALLLRTPGVYLLARGLYAVWARWRPRVG